MFILNILSGDIFRLARLTVYILWNLKRHLVQGILEILGSHVNMEGQLVQISLQIGSIGGGRKVS